MYGKVFSSMYDGTLATKGPWQALVTFQQMIVLADKDGVVDMTAHAISRRTSIPLEIIEAGIVELALPDPESRSAVEDGRRIVLLEGHRTWGWQIVNYAKYAALRSAEERREYMRIAQAEHRARVKAAAIASKDVMTSQDKSANVKKSTDVPVPVPVDGDKTLSTPSVSHPRKRGSASVEGFDIWWREYPRKTAKADALKAFTKLAPSSELLDEMVAAVRRQALWDDWRRGFIPHGATWISGRRWEDVKTADVGPPETAYARQMREKYEQISPGLAARRPGSKPSDIIDMEANDGSSALLG